MIKYFSLIFILTTACAQTFPEQVETKKNLPSKAPTINLYHGEEHIDKDGWLRSDDYPNKENHLVTDFLNTEQKKSDEYFAKHPELTDVLLNEMISRIPGKNKPLSYEDKNFIYSTEFIGEAKYKTIHITNKKTKKRMLLIDENTRAANHEYYNLKGCAISPDGRYVAFTEDTEGAGNPTLYVQDIESREMVTTKIVRTGDNIVWGKDSSSLYYVLLDDIGRDFQLRFMAFHESDSNNHPIIYTEKDESLFLVIQLSKSEEYIFVESVNSSVAEARILSMKDGIFEPKPIIPKELGSEHWIEHYNDTFFILTNLFKPNYDAFTFRKERYSPEYWKPLYEKDANSLIKAWSFIGNNVVFIESSAGSDKLRIFDINTNESNFVKFDEDIYGISFGRYKQSKYSNTVRFSYQSMLSPRAVMDFDMVKRKLTVINQAIPPSFDKKEYTLEKLYAESYDGTKVPISIMYNNRFGPNIDNPLALYVYGAYGDGIPPEFPTIALSAIDRGFTFAIAHVRGGNELGNQWHDQGKKLNRKNTFNDFLSVSRHLIDIGYVKKGNISIYGESSGGTVIANAINTEPNLYRAAGMLVPFVDVMNTLMDSSLIYTVTDWEEFGNPLESKEVFDYMVSYSPYENIATQSYPPIYATAALSDPAVGYWEIAKYIAKINDHNTGNKPVLMDHRKGGHITSGKNSMYYTFAKLLSFLLIENGITK
jgi:oligopeptidase B